MAAKAVCPDHNTDLPPACPECEAIMARPVSEMTRDERRSWRTSWSATAPTNCQAGGKG